MDFGPFSGKHVLIGGMIIVVTCIAMFFLKNILGFGIVLPLWIMVAVIITIMVIISILILTIMGYLRWGAEGFLFAKARKEGKGVYIDCELGSEVGEFVLAEKSSPKDVVLLNEDSGIKVDPSMLDSYAKPLRMPLGLDLYIYSYYNFMPQTIRNHAAFKEIKKYFDTQCRELNFLSIKEFIELISTPEHSLEHNAMNMLNKYFKLSPSMAVTTNAETGEEEATPIMVLDDEGKQYQKFTYVRQFMKEDGTWVEQDLDLSQMEQLIAKARTDIAVMPIMGGLLTGTEAFKYNSVAYSSQHLGHVLMLYWQKLLEDDRRKIEWLTIGVTALLILCGAGFAIYAASMAFSKLG
jgi:hypothetical protein